MINYDIIYIIYFRFSQVPVYKTEYKYKTQIVPTTLYKTSYTTSYKTKVVPEYRTKYTTKFEYKTRYNTKTEYKIKVKEVSLFLNLNITEYVPTKQKK